MDQFQSMDAFVRVADAGSFAEASRQLGVSKSVVTSRVQQLEEFIGASLFHRNTRNVVLSELGMAYYRECADLICRATAVMDQMRESKGSPAGILKIHALPGFVLGNMARLLQKFQLRHPNISLDIVVNDAVADPVREGFDCALQILSPSSEDLIVRRIFPVRRVFCASPNYISANEEIRHPSDLLRHRLGLYSRYESKDKWTFHRGGESATLELHPSLKSNSVHLLRDYAVTGAGVVCIPTIVASEEIMTGRLKVVLGDFQLSSFWLSAVYAPTNRNSFKLKLFLDDITESYSEEPHWDRNLIANGYIGEGLV